MFLPDEWMFWDPWPLVAPTYEALRERLLEKFPETKIKVSKSQISFYNRHMFAMASPPTRRKKDWPKDFVLLTFGLARQETDSRIKVSVEPYPGRWTHHVLLKRPEDVDAQVMAWLEEAYDFSESKR